jgi:ATP-binding cassette, subfamily F, member 3
MIQIEDLSKSYGGHEVIQKVSFVINRGERCALVGRNGAGKTTLFRILAHIEIQDSGTISTPKGYRIGYLEQHVSFNAPTLLEEVARFLPEDDRDSTYKAEKILFGLGFIEEDMSRTPQGFSGGFQLRMQLAKILVSEPDCLLLDEPTNYLDILSIRWLSRFLRGWKGELVIISHDRDFLDDVCTHTLGIHRHAVVKVAGGTDEYYTQVALQEEVHEKTRLNVEKKKAHMQSFVDRFGAKASKAVQAQSRMKAISRLPALEKLAEIDNLNFSFPYAQISSEILVQVDNIRFSYPDQQDTVLIHDLSFVVEKDDRIAIIGKNGKGKSTLLKLLAQEMYPTSGAIRVREGVKFGYFGQTNVNRLRLDLTIEEEIRSSNSYLSQQDVRSIAGLMMFDGEKAKKKIGVLSGGEKSRVLLGKIIASPCNVLLLDEPSNHLDIESIDAMTEALTHFPGAILIVSHNELLLRQIPEKLIVFREGRQDVFLDGYESFLEKGGWDTEEKLQEAKSSVCKNTVSKLSKQKRAELVTQRSKATKPIQEKIAYYENMIINIEIELEKLNFDLIAASERMEGRKIQELAKLIDEKKNTIDTCFHELETLYHSLDSEKAKFQSLFDQLGS